MNPVISTNCKLVKVQELLNQAENVLAEVSQCYCTEMDEGEVKVRFADGKATCEKAIERLLGIVNYSAFFSGTTDCE